MAKGRTNVPFWAKPVPGGELSGCERTHDPLLGGVGAGRGTAQGNPLKVIASARFSQGQAGQLDFDVGAHANLALDVQLAAVQLSEPFGDSQAQARPLLLVDFALELH